MKRLFFLIFLLTISPIFLNAQIDESKPVRVSKAYAYVKTAPLTELVAKLSPDKSDAIPVEKEVKNILNMGHYGNGRQEGQPDIVQSKMGAKQSRGQIIGFNGQGPTGSYPPDTDGDVSETHFVQMVNSKYNVYLKDGTKVLGPLNLSTLWSQLPGGPWGNSGDPIVLYDEAAERWVLTQFAPRNNFTQNFELFAVSETNDPTGSYHLYAFAFGNQFNDYPKIGIWSDGYYATYNMFTPNGGNFSHLGAKITSVDREKMLIGDPDAEMIEFFKEGYYSTMPADIDGEDIPAPGAPCPVMYMTNSDEIEIWNFTSDWENTTNSSLIKQDPNLFPTGFIGTPNTNQGGGGYIKQPGTNMRLDGLGAMIMNRLAYRKFDTHESMVITHSILVQPDGGGSYDRSGIRWYEVRRTDDIWELHQEGTFAPDDGVHRWMGSAAMNANGDIAIAYSVSDEESVYPSIRYTGRHATDLPGIMSIEEEELKTGTSSQNHWRWGDYACLNVDPDNDTVFWFTTEYNGWRTWISSFDLGTVATTSNAGEDTFICTNDFFETQGSGTGVYAIEWTTDGDGYFTADDQFINTYVRGSQDVANHGCTLTLSVTGFDGNQINDDIVLSIGPWVDAGENAYILDTESFQLQAEGTESGTISWATSGSGSFSNTSIMQPIYTPSEQDLINGSVILNVEVSISEPCESSKSDEMILNFSSVGINEINTAKLNIYPNPTSDIFTLYVDGLNIGEEFTYLIYTSYGKEVYRELNNIKSTNYQKVIDMTDFIGGIYFVSVKTEKGTITQKLVKL